MYWDKNRSSGTRTEVLGQEPKCWDKNRSTGTRTEVLGLEPVPVSLFLPQTLPFTDLGSNLFSGCDLKLKMLVDSRDYIRNVASKVVS